MASITVPRDHRTITAWIAGLPKNPATGEPTPRDQPQNWALAAAFYATTANPAINYTNLATTLRIIKAEHDKPEMMRLVPLTPNAIAKYCRWWRTYGDPNIKPGDTVDLPHYPFPPDTTTTKTQLLLDKLHAAQPTGLTSRQLRDILGGDYLNYTDLAVRHGYITRIEEPTGRRPRIRYHYINHPPQPEATTATTHDPGTYPQPTDRIRMGDGTIKLTLTEAYAWNTNPDRTYMIQPDDPRWPTKDWAWYLYPRIALPPSRMHPNTRPDHIPDPPDPDPNPIPRNGLTPVPDPEPDP